MSASEDTEDTVEDTGVFIETAEAIMLLIVNYLNLGKRTQDF